jgi:hypothetical protein
MGTPCSAASPAAGIMATSASRRIFFGAMSVSG